MAAPRCAHATRAQGVAARATYTPVQPRFASIARAHPHTTANTTRAHRHGGISAVATIGETTTRASAPFGVLAPETLGAPRIC